MHTRRFRWFAALLLALSVVAAACAEEQPSGGSAGSSGGSENTDFKACQVTDTGGKDDKSFNQTAYKGMLDAQKDLGTAEPAILESQSQADFDPNINALLQQDCDIIITVGFLLGDATAKAAQANPDQKFAIVDFDFFDADAGKDITYDNVRELTFSTDQAAFLAGYLAAGMTQTGTVGTFGGLNIPTVTIFMDGFQEGVEYYNQQNGTNVNLEGWDKDNPKTGLFTGDFENQDNGRNVTENLLGEGADIVMPVAGPVGLGAAAAVQDADDASMVWVDTDGCVSAPEFCSLFLTSVMKKMDVAVEDTIRAAMNDSFQGGLYTGTLENDGVAIAPYHEFDSKVPDDLKQQVEDLKQQIISGEIKVGG